MIIRLLPLLITLGACDPGACNYMGCTSGGADVTFEHTGWSDTATYTLTVVVDGTEASCSGTLAEFECADAPFFVSASEDGIRGISVDDVPGSLSLSLERDGVVEVTEAWDPEPLVEYPNGEECGPTCESWETTLTW